MHSYVRTYACYSDIQTTPGPCRSFSPPLCPARCPPPSSPPPLPGALTCFPPRRRSSVWTTARETASWFIGVSITRSPGVGSPGGGDRRPSVCGEDAPGPAAVLVFLIGTDRRRLGTGVRPARAELRRGPGRRGGREENRVRAGGPAGSRDPPTG